MSNAKIKYLLNEEGRKESLKTGGDGRQEQIIECDAIEILDIPGTKVDTSGNVYLDVSRIWKIEERVEYSYGENRKKYCVEYGKILFDKPQTVESIVAEIKSMKTKKDLEAEVEELNKEFYQWQIAKEEEEIKRKEEERKQELERIEQQKAEKERIDKDRLEWIEKYGSEYLKKVYSNGYKANKEYVIERANHEIPNYTVEYNGTLYWKDILSPSIEALEEVEKMKAEGHEAEIVWLVDMEIPDDNDESIDIEDIHYEGVIIHNYLGKYIAFKIID